MYLKFCQKYTPNQHSLDQKFIAIIYNLAKHLQVIARHKVPSTTSVTGFGFVYLGPTINSSKWSEK